MKKIVALSVLGAACAGASAQSAVNLFGVVDVGVRHQTTAGEELTQVHSNGLSSSRIGLKGTEDVGSGMKVGFWLESGVNLTNGAVKSDRFWGRRSTVSLLGDFGEIRMGRDDVPTADWGDFDVFGGTGIGHTGKFETTLGSNAKTHSRADGLVSYLTPSNMGGFYGQVSAAPSMGTPGNKYIGGRVGYDNGKLNVSGSYGQTWADAFGGTGSNLFKVAGMGANYDFKVAKLTSYVGVTAYGTLRQATYQVGAEVPIGKNSFRIAALRASATGLDAKGVDTAGNGADQLAVGYLYSVSKRTTLYADAAAVRNRGKADFAIGGLSQSTAVKPAGFTSVGYQVGIRHTF